MTALADIATVAGRLRAPLRRPGQPLETPGGRAMTGFSDRREGGTVSIFNRMSLEELLDGARSYASRRAYLDALGFKKRDCLGLSRRMAREGLTVENLWPNPWGKIARVDFERHALDLLSSDHAYFYGLALADGCLQAGLRNRGSLSIELRSTDDDVLRELRDRLPWAGALSNRTRQSPFDATAQSVTTALRFCGYDLRRQLAEHGFPIGAKSRVCAPPTRSYRASDFWRGYIDGDGSIGVARGGWPFVSLITVSEPLAAAYRAFLERAVGFAPRTQRNARDGAFNIMVTRARAAKLCRALYGEQGAIAMPRKREKAIMVMAGADVADPWRD